MTSCRLPASHLWATGTRNLVANSQVSVAKLCHQSSNSKGSETKATQRAGKKSLKCGSGLFSLFGNSLRTKPYSNLLKLRFSCYFRGNGRFNQTIFEKLMKWKKQRPARQNAGWIGARKREFWGGKFMVDVVFDTPLI